MCTSEGKLTVWRCTGEGTSIYWPKDVEDVTARKE